MAERLKIYFIHSTKYDYNELIYKPVLLSNICVMQDLILPLTDSYKNKYAKDLINSSDIIIAEVSKFSFGIKIELKWALESGKPILFYSLTNKVPLFLRKYVNNLAKTDETNSSINLIENFINDNIKKMEEEENKTVVLGEI
jgi:nucleoside 2-deoxyribosyltransferase